MRSSLYEPDSKVGTRAFWVPPHWYAEAMWQSAHRHRFGGWVVPFESQLYIYQHRKFSKKNITKGWRRGETSYRAVHLLCFTCEWMNMRTRLLMARNFFEWIPKKLALAASSMKGEKKGDLFAYFSLYAFFLITRACMSKSTRLKIQKIPVLLFTSSVSFRKLFAFLNPQFSHL